ncbi:hypothetical protein [Paraglaciecola sp. 25GB23A]|jgi:hypothetical protein|uniref:hypothetical protein n=1 Tax=Paraglaciecola sp. 25GB23A TaxID=3156068 RepID=UPI0032AED067
MAKIKHQKSKGHFAGVPAVVMQHPDYIKLGYSARSLLFELALQCYGHNNGKLCAIHAQLIKRGFGKGSDTITNALRELLDANLIVCTKVGMFGRGKKQPNYYAVTWRPINDIKGFEMDIKPTNTPPRQFSIELRLVTNDKAA